MLQELLKTTDRVVQASGGGQLQSLCGGRPSNSCSAAGMHAWPKPSVPAPPSAPPPDACMSFVLQEIDSVEYGLTDIQEYYANTGALKRAAQVRHC